VSRVELRRPAPALRVAGGGVDLRWMLGLFALALALRLGFVLAVTRPAFPNGLDLPFNDMLFYHATAKALADGLGFIGFDGNPTARWPPAFPFLLSLVYRVFGAKPENAELLNAFLGAATVPLLYLVALRSFGRPAAKLAGVLLALMPGQILIAEGVLAETLYAFLLVGFFALLVTLPDRPWTAVALGAAVGAAALTRGEGLLLLIVPIAVWWGSVPRRTLALRAAATVTAAVVVVAPWTIRNAVELGSFVGISTNSSQTFWAGHNPYAYGGATYAKGEVREKIARLPKEDFEVEQARVMRKDALSWMVRHPFSELTLIPRKLVYLNLGDSRAIQVGATSANRERALDAPVTGGITPVITDDARAAVLIGTIADVAWYGLLALTAVALVLLGPELWRRPASRAAIVVIALAVVLYGFVFYGNFRYRMPLEPLMILLAASLLAALWEGRGRLRDAIRPVE
jgi:4-amino-4-deoxy-L-arabinose transferase-like glycosyltransferase